MAEDDDALTGTVDAMKAWTIPAFPVHLKNQAIAAARLEGVTVGQWLEPVIRERLAVGPSLPEARPAVVQGNAIADLAETVRLAMALAEAGPRPADPLLRTARGTVRAALLSLRLAAPPSRPGLADGSSPDPRQKRLAN